MWAQREITLEPRPRGIHLVTRETERGLPELAGIAIGLLHMHLLHTSAALALNENASPDVRADLASWFDRAQVPFSTQASAAASPAVSRSRS